MTTLSEEALANSVPAAAVRQRGQALFGITGRKGHDRRNGSIREILRVQERKVEFLVEQ